MSISSVQQNINYYLSRLTATSGIATDSQTTATSAASSIGAAASLTLSAAGVGASSSSSGASSSTSCPQGKSSCTSCGQCGKPVSSSLAQTGSAAALNYYSAAALQAYDKTQTYL
ncbi:hypothetical protein [Azotosporobacter soli]|uniref:hypothetical protein n=1 Tax=Azotosporobacter soli TaxID=3055040 RepID=UPI0031FEAED5